MKNNLTKDELKTIKKIRERGFAVIVWTPSELGKEVSPEDMEEISISRGWDYIDDGR